MGLGRWCWGRILEGVSRLEVGKERRGKVRTDEGTEEGGEEAAGGEEESEGVSWF